VLYRVDEEERARGDDEVVLVYAAEQPPVELVLVALSEAVGERDELRLVADDELYGVVDTLFERLLAREAELVTRCVPEQRRKEKEDALVVSQHIESEIYGAFSAIYRVIKVEDLYPHHVLPRIIVDFYIIPKNDRICNRFEEIQECRILHYFNRNI